MKLSDLLADAVADEPPTTVTAQGTFRRGRRRRRVVRTGAACGVAAVVALATLGVAALDREPAPPPAVGPRIMLEPLPATPTGCAALAEAVRAVAAATLPADIRWIDVQVADEATCDGGGLFWVHFAVEGKKHRLGFEGGEQASGEPCDAGRGVTTCDDDGTYRIGHYAGADDYGVLLGRPGLFFFLGLDSGTDPPLTTDQLATVAKEVDRVVFPR
jgi:hypothetical protein